MTGYEIRLNIFEGPLDLLLYLIRKNEVDIYDIPIAVITEQYFRHLDRMTTLNLDIASDYLVMASILLHIKSRMLLPVHESTENGEGEEDPRMELTRQLLEYETFKKAALAMETMPLLDRDVFLRGAAAGGDTGTDGDPVKEISVFELVEAFRSVLDRWKQEDGMELNRETLSVTERIQEILEQLNLKGSLTFNELLENVRDRVRVIYTFLALLELVKLRIVKAFQSGPYETIRIRLAVSHEGSQAHS